MNEEDLMIADDQDLEELLRQRLLARQDQEQVGVGAGGAIGAGLAGFGSLLAGQNPLAATQSVLNSAQQLEQQRLRAKALENQATLGALRNISQERQRAEMLKNANYQKEQERDLKRELADLRNEMEQSKLTQRSVNEAQKREEKPLTDSQAIAAGFGQRAMLAEKDLQNLLSGGFDPTTRSTQLKESLPSFMESFKDDKTKAYEQAKRNFVTAVLRKESGAAIPEEELQSEYKKYFPQAGDGPTTIAQKERARKQAVDNLRLASGPAWNRATMVDVPTQQRQSATPDRQSVVNELRRRGLVK